MTSTYDGYGSGIETPVRRPRSRRKVAACVGLIILAVVLVITALVWLIGGHTVIDEGFMGVRYRFGEMQEVYTTPGWKWHAPIIDRVEPIDVREQVLEYHLTAYTRDTQVVEDIECQLNFQYDTSRIDYLVRNIGIANVASKLIDPAVSSYTKNDIGKYKAEELVQNRSLLQEQVETELRDALASYGINVRSLNIKNIDFEDSFEKAVNAKIEAEQKAQQTKNETETVRELAQQDVVKAEAAAEAKKLAADAEAYAIQVIQEQLANSPEYTKLQMVEKWNGKWPDVMGNEVNPFVIMENENTTTNQSSGASISKSTGTATSTDNPQ